MALSNLQFEDVDMGEPFEDNPFFDVLEQSYKSGKSKGVRVHTSEVDGVKRLIRSAATQLMIGAKIRTEKPDEHENVLVKFCGKERRPRKSPKKNSGDNGESGTSGDSSETAASDTVKPEKPHDPETLKKASPETKLATNSAYGKKPKK